MKRITYSYLPILILLSIFLYLLFIFLGVKREIEPELGSNYFLPFPSTGKKSWTKRNRNLNRSMVYILDWTGFFGEWAKQEYLMDGCPWLPCRVTADRRVLRASSAVVFHVPNLRSFHLPLWRNQYQMYVMTMWESPTTLQQKRWVDLNNFGGKFNLTLTYRYDSDIVAPYGRLIKLRKKMNETEFVEGMGKIMKKKTKLMAWFVSHCSTDSKRERLVGELRKHIPVDIYGECGKLKCDKNGNCDIRTVLGKYKFYLSLENSICRDYVTEKFYDPLKHDVVPIVLGGAGNFESKRPSLYPDKGYILITDYGSVKELADYLLYLDSNPDEYLKYFDWKREYAVVSSWPRLFSKAYCDLCQKVIQVRKDFGGKSKSYSNISNWWREKGECDNELVPRFLNVNRSVDK